MILEMIESVAAVWWQPSFDFGYFRVVFLV
jgi:hypothetical protein